MALKPLSVDVTGKYKAGGVAPIVTDFDVGVGGQSQFTIGIITASTYIEVLVNGVANREGATFDYQRTVASSRIDFNFTVPQDAWVRIKVYP